VKVTEEIQKRHLGALLEPMELDLASVPSIIKFSQSIESLLEASNNTLSLQLLINNAAILATTERKTSEGYEW
jgi:NAD(P)-dependent dehydrogenase (short-subunit alcohol dehydrogenase family)